MGRPKKEEDEKQRVVSIRFSLHEQRLLALSAKEDGFSNWKEYFKQIALTYALNH